MREQQILPDIRQPIVAKSVRASTRRRLLSLQVVTVSEDPISSGQDFPEVEVCEHNHALKMELQSGVRGRPQRPLHKK